MVFPLENSGTCFRFQHVTIWLVYVPVLTINWSTHCYLIGTLASSHAMVHALLFDWYSFQLICQIIIFEFCTNKIYTIKTQIIQKVEQPTNHQTKTQMWKTASQITTTETGNPTWATKNSSQSFVILISKIASSLKSMSWSTAKALGALLHNSENGLFCLKIRNPKSPMRKGRRDERERKIRKKGK